MRDMGGVVFGDRPANIVVTANIGGKAGAPEAFGKMAAQHMGHHPCVTRCQSRPILHHQAVVIGKLADASRMSPRPKVGDKIGGADNRFGLVDDGGGGHPRGLGQGLQDVVDLGQVLTARAHAFPHEGNGIKAKYLHALVGQKQDRIKNREENLGVFPVQIPLVFIECGPDPFAHVGIEGEVTRCLRGENLDQRLLVLPGQAVVIEHPVKRLIKRITRACLLGPSVFLGGVVQHHVDAGADTGGTQRQVGGLEIGHAAQGGVDAAVILDRIAPVRWPGPRQQAGHHMRVGHAKALQIRDVCCEVFQPSGEFVDVKHIADHILRQEPVGVQIADQIQPSEVGRARAPVLLQQITCAFHQGFRGDHATIKPCQRANQVALAAVPAQRKQFGSRHFSAGG